MLQQLTQELIQCFESNDYEKCQKLLVPIKIELIKNKLLIPIINKSVTKDQLNDYKICQNILEIGALSSLNLQNYSSFENYYNQLRPFYYGTLHTKSLNTQCTKIISLYLVYLLSQGLISKFHIELENLGFFPQYDLFKDNYLAFPVNLEKNLMEGNYIKIWNLLNDSSNLPCSEYNIFTETLVNALRYEIAKSLERAYTSIPINNCKNLLYYQQQDSDNLFLENLQDLGMNWNIKNGYIYFSHEDMEEDADDNKIMKNVLNYAEQIESII